MTKRSLTPRRNTLLTVVGLSVVVAVGAAACGGSSSGGSPADAVSPSAGATTAGAAAATVGTSHGDGGTYLVDAAGRTLYLFEADKTSTSTCTGACATAWPPAIVSGSPQATGAAKAKLLGTTTRSDGTTQLTYAGHPLYRFSGDSAPGDTNGAGSEAFGAEWYPVTPAGETLEGSGESDSDTAPSPSTSGSNGYSYSY